MHTAKVSGFSLSSILFSSVLLLGCSSTDQVSVSATSTTSSTVVTTTTTPVTTTTMYVGPPTLAPGQTLPTPENLPPEDAIEPEVIIGELIIPALMLSQTIFKGMSLPTLDKGVGYWPGTALPGQVGNVVLGGHRVSKKKPFRNLEVLVPGDEVFLTTSDGTFVYAVTRTEIVDPTEVRIIDQTENVTLTMFACHPPGSVKQRIVVFADYLREENV